MAIVYTRQQIRVRRNASSSALPAATGGTAPYTYQLGVGGLGTIDAGLTNWGRVGSGQQSVSAGHDYRVDFAVSPAGQLYAATLDDQAELSLFTVSTTTGAWTQVGSATPLRQFPGRTAALKCVISFAPNGTCYIMVLSATNAFLGTMNLVTGAFGNAANVAGESRSTIAGFEVVSNTSAYIVAPGSTPAIRTLALTGRAVATTTLTSPIAVQDMYHDGSYLYVNSSGDNAARITISDNTHVTLNTSGSRGTNEGLAIIGTRLYTASRTSNGTSYQLYAATLTPGGDTGAFSTTLPTGISFNATTRVVNVASTAALGYVRLSLRSSDSDSPAMTHTARVDLTVLPQAGTRGTVTLPTTTANLARLPGQGRVTVTPSITGGHGTVSFSLVSPPAGISLQSSTATSLTIDIDGTVASGTHNITVRTTWTADGVSATRDSNLSLVVTRPAAGAFSPTAKTLSTSSAGTGSVTYEVATGGSGTISYRFSGLPTGVRAGSGTTLSISSTARAGTTSISITATWTTAGGTATLTRSANLIIQRTLAPRADVAQNRTYTITVPPLAFDQVSFSATGGRGEQDYRQVSSNGLYLWRQTGATTARTATLFVRPVSAGPQTLSAVIRVTRTTVEGSRSVDITVTVTVNIDPAERLRPLPRGTWAVPSTVSATVVTGTEHRVTLPAATSVGGARPVYVILGRPVGVRFDTANLWLIFSGTYTTGTVRLGVYWDIPNRDRSGAIYTIRVNLRRSGAAATGTFTPGNRSVNLSSSGTSQVGLTAATGGTGTVTYSLRGSPPAGLTINSSTAVVTVGTNTPAGTYTINVRATWSVASTSAFLDRTFTLVVNRTQAPSAGSWTVANKSVSLSSSGTDTLTLEAASGGTGTIAYTLVSPPTGITLSGRTITVGSTAAAGTPSITARATWTTVEGSQALTRTFTIRITRTLAPAAGTFSVSNKTLNLTSSSAGTFALDAATGGTGTVTYALVSPPTGITLSGRTVSVAASVAAAAISLTARATWTTPEGTRSLTSTFTLTVTRTQAPAAGTFTISAKSLNLTHDGSGTVNIDAATGGTGAITYALVSPPAGITLSGRTITVAGTVTAGAKNLTARATWTTPEGSRTADASFVLTVTRSAAPAQAGTLSIADKSVSLSSTGSTTLEIEAASGGTGTVAYAQEGSWPAGITLSGRTVTVASSAAAGTHNLTVRATWTSGATTAFTDDTFALAIARTQAPAAGSFSVSNQTASATWNGSTTVTINRASGGTGTVSYSLVNPPTGFSLSGRTLTIAGSVTAGVHNLAARATWTTTEGSRTVDSSFTVTLTRSVRPAETGTFTLSGHTYGRQLSTATITRVFTGASGGFGTITHSLVSPPAGVTLSGTTLSFAPAAVGTLSVTVRATWASGTTRAVLDRTASFVIPRSQAPVAGTIAISAKSRALGLLGGRGSAGTVEIDAASGGTGTLTYALVSPPAGITLSGTTLSIGSNVAAGDHSLTVRATWTTVEGSVSASSTFTLTITRSAILPDAAVGTFTLRDVSLDLQGDEVGTITIPAASGGTGNITYSLINAPSGWTISGRIISVAASVVTVNQSLTVRATWTSAPSSTPMVHLDRTFTVAFTRTPDAVAGVFTVADKTISTSSAGTGSVPVERASGGVGSVTYALLAPPPHAGITFASQAVSITAAVPAGTYSLTVRASWSSGTTTATADSSFNLVVERTLAPSAGTFRVSSKTLNLSSTGAGTTDIEEATGGVGTVSYRLISPPANLSLSARSLQVAANYAAGSVNITIRATWTTVEGSRSVDATFQLTVSRTEGAASGTFAISDKTLALSSSGTGSVTIEAATGGTGTISYQAPGLPQGITLTGRVVSVSSTVPAQAVRLTITAVWTTVEGTASSEVSFLLTITRTRVAVAGTFVLDDITDDASLGDQHTITLPPATGGTGDVTYALLSPPAGFSLIENVLHLAASVPAGVYNLRLRATWTTQEGTATAEDTFRLTLTRTPTRAVAGVFNVAHKTISLPDGEGGTLTFEAASGGAGDITYRATITRNVVRLEGRQLHVLATAPAGSYELEIRATWSLGDSPRMSVDRRFTLTILRPTPADTRLPAVGDKPYRVIILVRD